MTCPKCGAEVSALAGRCCKHCGALLPDAPKLSTDEYRVHPERFAAARSHPTYLEAMAFVPSNARFALEIAAPIGMTLLGAAFFTLFAQMAGSGMPTMMKGMVGFIAVVWMAICGGLTLRGVRRWRAPLERSVAVVTGTRTQVLKRDESTTTSYVAELADEAGARRECACDGKVMGSLSEGDIGVAYIKRSLLVAYTRLPERT